MKQIFVAIAAAALVAAALPSSAQARNFNRLCMEVCD
jgi:hypothetical protein